MSWEVVKLGEICTVIGGATPKTAKKEFWDKREVPWITPKDISSLSTKFLHESSQYISKKGYESCATKTLPIDSILLTSRAPIGNLAINTIEVCTNQGFKSLIPSERVDTHFIYYYLKSKTKQLNDLGNGATFKEISKKVVEGFEIPLPPLPEQQRIADILDKAEAINQKREQALALCDEFLRATFLDMFGDPVSNPKGWEVKRLSKFGEVITGSTPSRGKPEYYGNHIEWIKSDNINTPNNYITRAKEFLSVEGESVGRSVPENSILMTCIAGSLDCIGNIALADRKVSFNQQINGIVPNDDVDVHFLYSLLLYSKKYIQNHSTNSMKGMISKGKLSEIKFYLPEMAIQKEFSDIFLKIESLRNKIQHAQELPLFDALSQQAFKGELTQ